MELLRPVDAEQLGLDCQSLRAWVEAQLQKAPVRTRDHWQQLARVATPAEPS